MNPESLINLGSILAEQNENDDAIECYEKVLALEPTHQIALYSLAGVLANQSRMSEAQQVFEKLLHSYPTDALKIKAALQIPIIAPSVQALVDWRNEFSSKIDELIKTGVRIKDPLKELGKTNFYLAFQGFDNLELNNKVAQLMVSACPSLVWTAPHCLTIRQTQSRIRVGFISNFFHLHSIGKTSRGLIAELSRNRFEVHSLFVPPVINDPVSKLIQDSSDHYHILPNSLEDARKVIADLKLDILFYQDIGMEPFTYYLAFSRLAPVQCVSFGHPDTTGIDNIDYFVSTDFFETLEADSHYSEKLIRLHNVGTPTYYYAPNINFKVNKRSYFGLKDQTHLYFCPQTLFKFHPDFDLILANILNRDSQGVIVCLEAHIPYWTKLLKQRFQLSIGKAADRILFLPRQNYNDYLNLLILSDVVLDTIHFNGMNTSLEAFTVGTPVVTLPGKFQRGRHTSSMYRKMEIEECIAHNPIDYTELAVHLASDNTLRKTISSKILERNSKLFKDRKVLERWEDFFTNALNSSIEK
ncbi:tetratricopeptide repeat protein [Methylomonas sp. AM2-LC]|uniref:O-linked N-acetylglucosamine transferase, SPINDLY family protein n=1 Tax=Methylomonas sp. AM2-LC TaxID=3153301 RepID=UPI0032643EDB